MATGERQRCCIFVNMLNTRCFRDGDGSAVANGPSDQDLGNAGPKVLCDLVELLACQEPALFDGE